MPDPTLFVVFNARSGRVQLAQALAEVERTLRATGRRYEIVEAKQGSDVAAAASRAAGFIRERGGMLAAAGGDGTLSSVAHAAFEADVDFGAVPLGTFNYFAREYGIPLEPAEAARVLVDGKAQPVQVGLINERVFLVNASLGLYPRLLEDREAFKAQYGRTRWVALVAAAWTVLTRRQPRLLVRITEDGAAREVRVATLFVGNNPLQLANLGIREAQAVEAGELAAIRVRPTSLWGLIDVLLHGAIGRLGQSAGVEAFAFRIMEVAPVRPPRRARALKVAVDGERLRMKLPIVFRVAPRPLRLVR